MLAALLSAIVAWAAMSVAVRARLGGRAETLAGATVVASSIVLGPIYVLGTTGTLTRVRLAISVIGVATAAWAWASRHAGVLPHARETARALGGIVRMPLEGLAQAWREGSVVLPCLAFCLAVFLWNLAAASVATSWRQWDALWYHEPIIGFTLQNRGFDPVSLFPGGAQKINGYPRAGEMLSLWLAAFGGRALIDMPNVLLMPGFFAAVHAMARRLTGDRLVAAGWAAVASTVPANVELLQSVYVDPALATFLAIGAMFVLRTPARSAEMLLGAAALAIAANIKVSGVFPVVVLSVIAATRLLRAGGWRQRRVLLTAGLGASMILALSSATYLGNLRKYHNPVWPDMTVRVPALGIDWEGVDPPKGVDDSRFFASDMLLRKNVNLVQLARELVARPGSIQDSQQTHVDMYGFGVVWVLIPAAALVFTALGKAIARQRREPLDAEHRARLFEVLALLGTAGVTLLMSTNRAMPRYQLGTIALWVPVVAWAAGRQRVVHQVLVLAATIGSSITIGLKAPDWPGFPGPRTMISLLALDPSLREMTPELGAPVPREAGLAREQELGDGATVVTDDFVFLGLLWNNRYTNRVVAVRASADLAVEADRHGATWIYANRDSHSLQKLRDNPAWGEVGPLYVKKWGSAFRRKQPAVPHLRAVPLPGRGPRLGGSSG